MKMPSFDISIIFSNHILFLFVLVTVIVFFQIIGKKYSYPLEEVLKCDSNYMCTVVRKYDFGIKVTKKFKVDKNTTAKLYNKDVCTSHRRRLSNCKRSIDLKFDINGKTVKPFKSYLVLLGKRESYYDMVDDYQYVIENFNLYLSKPWQKNFFLKSSCYGSEAGTLLEAIVTILFVFGLFVGILKFSK